MGLYGGASGAGNDQKWFFTFGNAFRFLEITVSAYMYVPSAHCLKGPSLVVTMVPSISVNSAFSRPLDGKAVAYQKKKKWVCMSI